jgi:hypothetical protein
MSDLTAASGEAWLDDAGVEALLSGHGPAGDRLTGVLAAVRAEGDRVVPAPSPALAAMLVHGLGSAPVRRRRGPIVLGVILAGGTTFALSGVAAAHNALPGPAQSVVTDIVNSLTPFDIGGTASAHRPPARPFPTDTTAPAGRSAPADGRRSGAASGPGGSDRPGGVAGPGGATDPDGGASRGDDSSPRPGGGAQDDEERDGSVGAPRPSSSDGPGSGSGSGSGGDGSGDGSGKGGDGSGSGSGSADRDKSGKSSGSGDGTGHGSGRSGGSVG